MKFVKFVLNTISRLLSMRNFTISFPMLMEDRLETEGEVGGEGKRERREKREKEMREEKERKGWRRGSRLGERNREENKTLGSAITKHGGGGGHNGG